MPKYNVEAITFGYSFYKIKTNSKEDALKKAKLRNENANYDEEVIKEIHYCVDSVEETK